MINQVNVKKLNENARLPVYGTEFSAGADLCSAEPGEVIIRPGETAFIHTGIALEIPEGLTGLIFARSGLACKKGIAPANKVGVIDSDYRGEIIVALYNQSAEEHTVVCGDRIAQLMLVPYVTAKFVLSDELNVTLRGEGGFGSTGNR